jgi:hypothetical protein
LTVEKWFMLSLRVAARAPQFSQREIRLSVSMHEWRETGSFFKGPHLTRENLH